MQDFVHQQYVMPQGNVQGNAPVRSESRSSTLRGVAAETEAAVGFAFRFWNLASSFNM